MKCLICNLDLDDYDSCQVQFGTIQKLIERSRTVRKDNLADALKGIETIRLHKVCSKKYNSPRYDTFKKITPYSITRAELDEMERLENSSHDQVKFEYVPMIRNTYKNKAGSYNSIHAKDKLCPKDDNSRNKTLPEFHGTSITTLRTEPDEVKNYEFKPKLECDFPNAKPNYENRDNGTSKPPDIQTPVDNAAITSEHEQKTVKESVHVTRLSSPPFSFKSKCFICTGDLVDKEKSIYRSKKNRHSMIIREQTQENILNILRSATCIPLPSPTYLTILQRIEGVNLLKEKANYHAHCLIKLRNINRPLKGPRAYVHAMEKIYRYIDSSAHTEFTIPELMSETIHGDEYVPIWRTVNSNLERHYAGKYYYTRRIVTILKESGSGVSRFSQPWNLNGTELGGQIKEDDVTMNRKTCSPATKIKTERKPYKKRNKKEQIGEAKTYENESQAEEDLQCCGSKRKTRSQVKQKHTENEHDIKSVNEKRDKKATNEIEIEIKEENDDDFINDTLYSDDDTKDIERNVLFCRICFSSDRKLDDLGKYRNVFINLCSDITIQDIELKLFLICWECRALLRNVEHFQGKIRIAQNAWKTEIPTKTESLSSLCLTSPDIFSNIDENQSTEQIEVDCKEMFQPEVVLVDSDIPSKIDEENTMEEEKHYEEAIENKTEHMLTSDDHKDESNIDNDTFDKQTKDLNTDEQEDHQEYEDKYDNDTFDNETGDLNTDEDDDVEDNQDGDKINDTSGDETDDTKIDRISKEQIKKSKKIQAKRRESEDPDWGTEVKEKRVIKKPKILPKAVKSVKIPYTLIIQTFLTETKMKREPIDPHELQHWLDTERNSDHFKSSKQKCMKCASEVPDNHNELCHSPAYPYVCKICESTFPSEYELLSHEANHYFIFICEFCPYKCYNETHMRNHVETHRRLVQCVQCFAAFESFELLSDHFNSLHHHAECDYCGKQFPHKHSVLRHIKSTHTPHKCPMCNAVYKSRSRLKTHMALKHRIERTEAAYCVQCDIQFDNELQFKSHLRVSKNHKHERDKSKSKVKPTKCPECAKIFFSNYYMKCHLDTVHAKTNRFYCKICNQAFTQNHSLTTHIKRKHEEGYQRPKNKYCDFCGRGFSTNGILQNHIRTHTGERPFACPHCPSSFAQKVALRSHIAHIHEQRQRTTAAKPSTSTQHQDQPSFFNYDY